MNDPEITYEQAVKTNLQAANEQLQNITGTKPTNVTIAGASVAQAFLLAALVAAVQDLTDEIRKAREGG